MNAFKIIVLLAAVVSCAAQLKTLLGGGAHQITLSLK